MGMGSITELGIAFADLVIDQAEWSRETFGSDTERGPIGALKHLAKEAVEAETAAVDMLVEVDGTSPPEWAKEKFKEEMADCLILVLDASRRGGVKVMQLVEAAQAKMKVNKARKWPIPTSDAPVEHIK